MAAPLLNWTDAVENFTAFGERRSSPMLEQDLGNCFE
jgi:hypothetical protein